jgi:hypothetical protein
MEPLKRQVKLILSLYLIILSLIAKAQSADPEVAESLKEKPYEIGSYMGVNRTVNLMIMVHQATGITIKIKDADDTILHEQYMKKSLKVYHYKLNFENSQSGLYKLEISDGRKILTRRIEVVDVPATEAQRYITFTSPVTQ